MLCRNNCVRARLARAHVWDAVWPGSGKMVSAEGGITARQWWAPSDSHTAAEAKRPPLLHAPGSLVDDGRAVEVTIAALSGDPFDKQFCFFLGALS